MNKVLLIGRLTRDPDIRNGNDSMVARYTLAVDRPYSKGEEKQADFISCVCFGRSAEFAEKFLTKGKKIAIEGRIQTGSYEKDGQKIYTTDVIVDRHEFCESKGAEDSGNGNSGYNSNPAPVANNNNGFVPAEDDMEMPFG